MVFLSHESQPGMPVLATTTRSAARPGQHERRRCNAIARRAGGRPGLGHAAAQRRDPGHLFGNGDTTTRPASASASAYAVTVTLSSLEQAGVLTKAPAGFAQRIALIAGLGWCARLAGRLLETTARRPLDHATANHGETTPIHPPPTEAGLGIVAVDDQC
jgi:hypothetical protein